MRHLKDVLPANANKVVYVFHDFAITQNKSYSDTAKAHVPKLVCVQQFCARCEDIEYGIDCERRGKRRYSFWNDPVGDLLTYVCNPVPGPIKL